MDDEQCWNDQVVDEEWYVLVLFVYVLWVQLLVEEYVEQVGEDYCDLLVG